MGVRCELVHRSKGLRTAGKLARSAVSVAVLCLGTLLVASPISAAQDATLVTPRPKPPVPPPSALVSESDFYLIEDAFDAIDRKRWAKLRKIIPQIDSNIASDVLKWHYLTRRDTGANFDEIVGFAEQHNDWPNFDRLLKRAEEAIPDDMPPQQVVAWFAGQEPITGEGKVRLGEALLSLGQEEFGKVWIERAWIDNNFTLKQERKILKQHKSNLSVTAHKKRLDRLLWHRQHAAARRVVPLVDRDHQTLAKARMRLASNASTPKSVLNIVPKRLHNDPGLLYERIRATRRRGQDEATHSLIFAAPKDASNLVRPEQWWIERHLQIRKTHKTKDFDIAYKLAINHGLKRGAAFAEAEWLLGWISLEYLGDAKTAHDHFAKLEDGVSYPISKARAHYWKGRATAKSGQVKTAREELRKAAQHPYTYYGQLALSHPLISESMLVLPEQHPPRAHLKWAFEERSLIKAIRLLDEFGRSRTERAFFYNLGDRLDSAEEFALLGDLALELNYTNYSVRVAKKAMQHNIALVDHSYPILEVPEYTGRGIAPDPALVFGLSRQESEFNPRAVSSADARGLMQLLPSTANITARKHKLAYEKAWLLDEPTYNTLLGMAHLSVLLERIDGSYIMTIAAYNAGARRVDQWVRDYGDPRDPKIDPIDWVESIPFKETRNYVQRVLENTQVYRNRLAGQSTPLQIQADLRRNSKSRLAKKINEGQQASLAP